MSEVKGLIELGLRSGILDIVSPAGSGNRTRISSG